jgi:hypothetical protein
MFFKYTKQCRQSATLKHLIRRGLGIWLKQQSTCLLKALGSIPNTANKMKQFMSEKKVLAVCNTQMNSATTGFMTLQQSGPQAKGNTITKIP